MKMVCYGLTKRSLDLSSALDNRTQATLVSDPTAVAETLGVRHVRHQTPFELQLLLSIDLPLIIAHHGGRPDRTAAAEPTYFKREEV